MSTEHDDTIESGELTPETEILRLSLLGLPAQQRLALEFAVIERLDVPSIAERMSVEVDAIHTLLNEALQSLRAVLDVIEPDPLQATPHVPDA